MGATKAVMSNIIKQVFKLDEQSWFTGIWTDNGHHNGNKLRTYRLLKKKLKTETYVTSIMPRSHRSVLAKLRCGSLPLCIETGRYCKPVLQLSDRLCIYCNS